jgi:hypothetical protein
VGGGHQAGGASAKDQGVDMHPPELARKTHQSKGAGV